MRRRGKVYDRVNVRERLRPVRLRINLSTDMNTMLYVVDFIICIADGKPHFMPARRQIIAQGGADKATASRH